MRRWVSGALFFLTACKGGDGDGETSTSSTGETTSDASSTLAASSGTTTGDPGGTSGGHGTGSSSDSADTGSSADTSTDDGGSDTGTPSVGCGPDDACDGDTLWNRRFGSGVASVHREEVDAIAALPDGGVVIAGELDEYTAFDDVASLSGPTDFIAALDPAGTVVWVREIQAQGVMQFDDVIADADGNIVVSGSNEGDLDIGTQVAPNDPFTWRKFMIGLDAAGNDRFLLRPDGSYGNTQLATGPGGAFGLVGNLLGTVDFDGTTLTSNDDSEDFIAAVFEVDGSLRWARVYGGDNLERGTAAAFDAAGDLFCAGSSVGPVDFGLDPVPDLGAFTLTLAKLDGDDGTPVLARQFGTGLGLAQLASDGEHIYLATADGGLFSSYDFGTGTVEGYYFLAAFDATGATSWARGFGAASFTGGAHAVAAAGTDVVISIDAEDGVDLGGGVLASANRTFAAKYAGDDGALLWARTGSGDGYETIFDIAGLPDGRSFVGGFIGDTLDFGLGDLGPLGGSYPQYNEDALVIALEP